MPESTSSQGSTPNPQNGANNPDSQWQQEHSPDTAMPDGMALEWIDLESYGDFQPSEANNNIVSQQIPNNVSNGTNQQLVLDPTNYIHVPYQRSTMPNGYTMNAPRRLPLPMSNGTNLIRAPNGQIIGGPNWSNQTPLGRFISQTPGWTPPSKPAGGVKKQKRIRTAFTSQQMMELEQEYARTRYLDRARRIELADILRLNERTIKIWFQNRRMKEKKDRAESLEDSEEASTTESSPEVSNSIQAPVHMQEQFTIATNEVYNRGGVYVEQYPVSSTSGPVPSTSVPTPATYALNYPMYAPEDQCDLQYQQVHFQMQQYPSLYGNEIQELSPEIAPQPENPAVNAPSDIIEKSWDLSWIKSIQTEDEY